VLIIFFLIKISGQEFYKLIIVDFILQFVMIIVEIIRKLFSKICNKESIAAEFDLEGKFLGKSFKYILNLAGKRFHCNF